MYVKSTGKRVGQGDILEKVIYSYPIFQADQVTVAKITLPYAVVLTQDCDLESDFNCRLGSSKKNPSNDKFLQSILVCPAYLAEQFRCGTHLEPIGLKMNTWTSEQWKSIKQNQNQRFHFLGADLALKMQDLVIDFKNYYTITRDEIYKDYSELYLVSLDILFREALSQRFAYFLSRIGLPTLKEPNHADENT